MFFTMFLGVRVRHCNFLEREADYFLSFFLVFPAGPSTDTYTHSAPFHYFCSSASDVFVLNVFHKHNPIYSFFFARPSPARPAARPGSSHRPMGWQAARRCVIIFR